MAKQPESDSFLDMFSRFGRDLKLPMCLANIFQPLIDIFEPVLVFFHDTVGFGWGWSIVALTICVR